MRTAFIRELTELAERDDRIMLVTGDLGFSVLEDFAERFPAQYLNVGVAEQNMTGIAAGLALSGKIPFTYSIANFPTMRCLEQVRNDVCYHQADVKIVAVGGGLAYGSLGYTHHAVEDLAVMRAMPHMTVVAPADAVEAAALTSAIASWPGPCYLRLGKAGERVIHSGNVEIELGRAAIVRNGDDVTLVSTGAMLATAVDAAEELARQGVAARVLSMHTLKPFDADAVIEAATETSAVVSIEEHSIVGGLASAIAEAFVAAPHAPTPFRAIALPSEAVVEVGSQDHLRAYYGLTSEAIKQAVQSLLGAPELPACAPLTKRSRSDHA